MIKRKKEFEDEDFNSYMSISAKKKLEFLSRMNRFLAKVTPEKSKKIWEKLRKEGY